MKRIACDEDVEEGLIELVSIDPALAEIAGRCRPLPLRLRPPGFHGLAEIIVSQQVSKASANAMITRLVKLVDPLDAKTLLQLGEKPMIEAGLSRAKQSTLKGLALKIVDHGLDLEALCQIPADEAQAELTALKGIGPWTAEVFLLFCAGHRDIFPAGDVALQHALGQWLKLDARPDEKQTRKLVSKWSPHRGIAARLFWAWYAILKDGRDVLP